MLRTTRVLTASLALAGLLGLSACGDTSKGESSSETTTTAAGGGSGPAADCSSPGETVTVDIADFKFDPTPVKVSACDEVEWKNTDEQAHTSTGNGAQQWSTGNIQPGDTSDPVAFDTPGTYTYQCALHPFMKATVEVS